MKEKTFWITENTGIPLEILQALDDDNLVLFIGAGASIGVPSNLPSFPDLVRDICSDTRHYEFLTPAERRLNKDANQLGHEVVLGRIFDDIGDTLYVKIKERLTKAFEEGRTNSIHQSIVKLALSTNKFRLVTTNQDRLLEHEELYAHSEQPKVFNAPALPDGSDFEGIVNLHGSISEPGRMVFTDRDFGEAYLIKQYCARFLTELFSRFTVLFVGYSHDDPLMKYHARGLRDCRRFVLTDKPDNPKWKILDITAIPYKSKKADHREVPHILSALSTHIKLSPGERRNKIKEVAVAGPLPLEQYNKSLLLSIFLNDDDKNHELLNDFFTHAKDHRWYNFLEENNLLRSQDIFRRMSQGDNYGVQAKLMTRWYLQTCFVTDDKEVHAFGFEKLMEMGWTWNATSIEMVLDIVVHNDTPEEVSTKLGMLCANRLNQCTNKSQLYYYLSKLDVHLHKSLVISLLEVLTRPVVTMKRSLCSYAPETPVTFDTKPQIFAEDCVAYLVDWWENNSDDLRCHAEILWLLSRNLEEYYRYIDPSNVFDVSSNLNLFAKNFYPYDNYYTVKMMRDILFACTFPIRREFVEKYQGSKYTLFIRLCIVAVARNSMMTSDDKITWLMDNDILLPEGGLIAEFEVYEVLSTELKHVSVATRQKLIDYIQSKHGWIDGNGQEYTRDQFVLCCYILKMRDDWKDVITPLINKYEQDKRWEKDIRPQRIISMAAFVPDASPIMEVGELICAIKENPIKAVDDLFSISTEYADRYGNGASATDNAHLRSINDVVQQDATIATILWDMNFQKSSVAEIENAIKLVIIDALRKDFEPQVFFEILTRLKTFVHNPQFKDTQINGILHYVNDAIRKNKTSLPDEIVTGVVTLCQIVWDGFNVNFTDQSDRDDIASYSPNFWPCSVVTLLLSLLELCNKGEPNPKGIPADIKSFFEGVLSTKNQAARYAIFGIFKSFQFVFWYDKDFACSKLMPIINTNSQVQKNSNTWYAWMGFIFNPVYDNKMLGEGLFDAIRNLLLSINSALSTTQISRYLEIVIGILSYSSIAGQKRVHLWNAVARDKRTSTEMMGCIYRFYADKKIEDGNAVWEKWVGEYVIDRLNNIPVKISAGEFTCICSLSFVVGEKSEQLVNEILRSKHKLNFDKTSVPRFRIQNTDMMADNHPGPLVNLICYILSNHQGNIDDWIRREILEISEKVYGEYREKINLAIQTAGIL